MAHVRLYLFALLFSVPLHAQTMTLSSYYGANASTSGTAIATDADGNAYMVTNTSSNLPAACGELKGTQNVVIAKINSNGTLGWCKYLGGANTDSGYGIALDAEGHIYVAGMTNSPGLGTTGAYQSTLLGDNDAFVAELSPTGTKLLGFTYLGTTLTSQANSMYVDSAGYIYITGYTTGNGWPVAGSVNQTTYGGGGFDIVAAKISPFNSNGPNQTLAWSGYLGGNSDDVGYRLAVSPDGSLACLDGYSKSYNYPTTLGAFQMSKNAARAAVVTCLNSSTGATIASTYFGGSTMSELQCNACAAGLTFDSSGNVWIVGLAQKETNFPITTDALQPNFAGGLHDAFISELTSDLSAVLYSTWFGGNQDDGAVAPEFDANGNLWIHGNTFSANLPVTSNAFQSTNGGPAATSDAFLAEFSPAGPTCPPAPWCLAYSTYLGGSNDEFGGATQSLAVAPGTGAIWFTGWTESTNLPLVDAFDKKLKASEAAFVGELTTQ